MRICSDSRFEPFQKAFGCAIEAGQSLVGTYPGSANLTRLYSILCMVSVKFNESFLIEAWASQRLNSLTGMKIKLALTQSGKT